MLSLFRLRGLVYTVVGTLVLTTLWVTSLAQLTARPAATDLLTEVGTQVLNPFLVSHGLGMSQSGYAALEAAARAHPAQPLTLSGLKAKVLGREIVGLSYNDATRVVYRRVGESYYDGGAQAAFAIPAQLQSALSTFAMFNPANLSSGQLPQNIAGQSLPQTPQLPQVPSFLQPLFTVTGLTPDTFTAAGHARLMGVLPFFWLALVIWMALTAVMDRSGNRFRALLRSAVHGTWPVVAVLVGVWALSRVYPATFAPYLGLLGMVSRTVLLVYGGALAFGVVALIVLRVARGRKPAAAPGPALAMAGVPAMRGSMGAQVAQAMQAMNARQETQGRAGMAQGSQTPPGWQEPQMSPGWERPAMPPSPPGPQMAPSWQQPEWQSTGPQPGRPGSAYAPQSAEAPAAPQMPQIPPGWDQPGWKQPGARGTPPSAGSDAGGTLPPPGESRGWQ